MVKSFFPNRSPGQSTLPKWPRADLLHEALSSAAVYAELARICASWNADAIEAVVDERLGIERQEHGKSFYATRDGSTLKSFRVSRLQSAFPHSSIMSWWEHPLAEVLCNPHLGIDSLLDLLRRLPQGPVRHCIWQKVSNLTPGFSSETLFPWTPALVSSFECIGTDEALFALVARVRMEQLLGNGDGGLESAQAAWRILPSAIAGCTNLLVAKDALILALDYFLSWQPFADARLYQLACFGGAIGRWEAVVRCDELWSSDKLIPVDTKMRRRRLVRTDLVPAIEENFGWWNMLVSPGEERTFPKQEVQSDFG